MVIVYTNEHCQPCKATKRLLKQQGTNYTEIPITDANRGTVRSYGHLQAPVVVTGNDNWSGYRPDKIKALKKII